MAHFLLIYSLADDYLERRTAVRDAHLRLAWAASERGELVLGGALLDPTDKAILLFSADSAAIVENFARADPYVTNGLVAHWEVRRWLTVAGDLSAAPVRPD
jgi:uncharacterized protein YciI